MKNIDDLALFCNHSITDCWNPHHHGSNYNSDSVKIFLHWYVAKVHHTNPAGVAPLCLFGGFQYSEYCAFAHASGTYAVCSKCQFVMSCGYHDKLGLGPRNCEICSSLLDMSDYFQPVFLGGSWVTMDNLVDPKTDPEITVAEVCALEENGIPRKKLDAIVCILAGEGLIKNNFIRDFVISGHKVESKAILNRIKFEGKWVDISVSLQFNVAVTKLGRVMLKAKNILPDEKARKRIKQLLALDAKNLQALAVRIVVDVFF